MAVRLANVTIGAIEPARLAEFWSQALGWVISYSDDEEIEISAPPDSGLMPDLVILRSPDEKTAKNRLHIDLRPDDQEAEVRRIEGLGATRVSIGQGPDATWVVLADPEGNEFCVLRPLRPDEL